MTARAREGGARRAPRLGAWGGYDVENYGDALFPRVLEHEMCRRLPDATLRLYAPLGEERHLVMNAGLPIRPLGRATPERRRMLASELDMVIIGGGELVHAYDFVYAIAYGLPPDALHDRPPSDFVIDGLGPVLERECPVVWHGLGVPFELDAVFAARVRRALAARPYVSVRDERSRDRLLAAGVEGEIAVVPDSVLLLPRLLPPSAVESGLSRLRSAGLYPAAGRPLVVQGHAGLVPHVRELAAAIEARRAGRPVVLASTFPNAGDADFADALKPLLGGAVFRLPAPAALEDVAAAIGGGDAFVGSSLHGAITAFAFGRPFLMLNLDGRSKIDGFAESVGLPDAVAHSLEELHERLGPALARRRPESVLKALHTRLDAHFDRLAQVATDAVSSAAAPSRAASSERLPGEHLSRPE
jgi:polysaccharide pyruvyl transferase WcaK-like protein